MIINRRGNVFGYSPTNVSNLKIWLDGANQQTLSAGGGLVYKVNDISDSGNYFQQATGALQPSIESNSQNALSTIKFNNAHALISQTSFNFSTIAPFTILYAVKFTGLESVDTFQLCARNDLANSTAWSLFYTPSNSVLSTLTRDTNFNIYGIRFGSDLAVKFFKNKSTSSHTALSTGTEATGARSIGARYDGSTYDRFCQVNLGELIMWNTALTDAEVNSAIEYLNRKWRAY